MVSLTPQLAETLAIVLFGTYLGGRAARPVFVWTLRRLPVPRARMGFPTNRVLAAAASALALYGPVLLLLYLADAWPQGAADRLWPLALSCGLLLARWPNRRVRRLV